MVDDQKESIANVDAEKSILGAILLSNEEWIKAEEKLVHWDFFLSSHQVIYQAICQLMRSGRHVDLTTLQEILREQKSIQKVGGSAYLCELTEGLPLRARIDDWVVIVKKKSQLRDLYEIGQELAARSAEQTENAEDLAAWVEQEALKVASSASRGSDEGKRSEEAYERLIRRRKGQETLFLPSGISAIDARYGGYASGELTVIGGRPKQGKSSSVMQVIVSNCSKGNPCDLYTMEMRDEAVRYRLWSIVSRIPFQKIRHPDQMSDDELAYVRGAMREVSQWPLHIDDRKLTADQVVSNIKIGKIRRKTKLAAVDYLQRMRFIGKDRFLGVTDASSKLADVANETGIAVVVLSSLTEKNGRDRNDPPTLQDLRMSGDIQYDAHSCYLIHRCINEEDETLESKGQIILAAARSDKGGALPIHYSESYLIFQ